MAGALGESSGLQIKQFCPAEMKLCNEGLFDCKGGNLFFFQMMLFDVSSQLMCYFL